MGFITNICWLLVTITASNLKHGSGQEPLVPAMFIFGDSLIDSGNNNNLASFAKANYLPYGIDFRGGPTGRFSNGYTMVDTLAQLLGLPLIPPYSQAQGSTDLMRYGINFASAAAGILDNTGGNFIGRIPFKLQVNNFDKTLYQLSTIFGSGQLSQELAKFIIFIGIGSNDYLNNYLMENYDTKNHYNAQQFADLLTHQYSQQLNRLYHLGVRKFVIAGLGLMGCTPSILAQSNTNGLCSDEVNELVRPFNINTKMMISNLSAQLPGSRYSYIDVDNGFHDLIVNSKAYGFSVVNQGCCGTGRNRGQISCLPLQMPCQDRDKYIFWDAFHPTEAVNVLIGQKAFSGSADIVYPINIQQLASL